MFSVARRWSAAIYARFVLHTLQAFPATVLWGSLELQNTSVNGDMIK